MKNAAVICPACGYDLRGHESVRCPECGREVDWGKVEKRNLAWGHRKQIGRVRAYVRTVGAVLWMPSVVNGEAQEMGDREGRRFVFWNGVVAVVILVGLVLGGLMAREGWWLSMKMVREDDGIWMGWLLPLEALGGWWQLAVVGVPMAMAGVWCFVRLLRMAVWWGRDRRRGSSRAWRGTAYAACLVPLGVLIPGIVVMRLAMLWDDSFEWWIMTGFLVYPFIAVGFSVAALGIWLGQAWKGPGRGLGIRMVAGMFSMGMIAVGAVASALAVAWVVGWLILVMWSLRA